MQVKWNKSARNTFDTAIGYGLTQFGEKAAADFYRQITDTEHLLAGHPHLGKTEPLLAHRKQEYRSLVVHQHYKIVYYIKGQTIRIVDLWDTRANPKRLTAHIR